MKIAVLLGIAIVLEILGSHLYQLKPELNSHHADHDVTAVSVLSNEQIKQADNPTIENNSISSSTDFDALHFTDYSQFDEETTKSIKYIATNSTNTKDTLNSNDKIDYWALVHSIESKQGRLLYRPRNKARNCTWTTGPCGHHQLTVKALKDIGCKSLQCRKDRLDYDKSLKMSKKLLALNEKRLKNNGYSKLEDYQRYLIHQQGANGIKNILAATQGQKVLSKKTKKNMANNSPFSYKQLRKMGSKKAAQRFMSHWENKWEKEKKIVKGYDIASLTTTATPKTPDSLHYIPTFTEGDIRLALNLKF